MDRAQLADFLRKRREALRAPKTSAWLSARVDAPRACAAKRWPHCAG
jgi:hypothetical protein